MKQITLIFATTLAIGILWSCARTPVAAPGETKYYKLRGTIMRLDKDNRVATIKHEKIEGWMEAMTMDFPVREPTEFTRLVVGAEVTARVCQTPADFQFWIDQIEVANKSAAAKQIQARFLAPCCFSENLAVHQSPSATELREEIESMVVTGKSEVQVVDEMVRRYGERVLREPRGTRQLTLMWIPVLVSLAGLALVVGYLFRAAHPPAKTATQSP